MTGTNGTTAHTTPTTAAVGEHAERPRTPAPSTPSAPPAGPPPAASAGTTPAPPAALAPVPSTGTPGDDNGGPRTRTRPTGTPGAAPTVPRPRRSPADRRPLGPAGSGPGAPGRSTGPGHRGPGSAGRGATRGGPRPGRPAALAAAASRRTGAPAPATPVNAAGVPLPTAGAQRRAHESRPHHWFAHQLVLALSGQRPVHALLGHALPAAYDRLAELAPQAPLRPVTASGRRGEAPAVRDCGLCRPCRGVIEAFARIAADGRLRALAFRLELGADSRWRCAALDIGPSPAVRGPAS
ncbi:Rv3235 family protein [Streptomyces sp. DSM 41527]|uniref:Rv3235 family protein n=1 Tax=Streptomyces mooreae TaxID=3075523 RepID=A0ABU2TBL9_9ACTN|nr:Rv3235 family protein [Streptomyces sp. DSM 41527]MDT0458328.1 Rv3235 family protein [Streptomyces sp. DSM 41527]